MGWTKRQLVIEAYAQIGYASYAFDLQSEQLQSAMRRLDAMMSAWTQKGIRVGYPVPTSPENADLDEETGIVDEAEAIFMNLAIRIAPTVGKAVSAETKIAAKLAYDAMVAKDADIIEYQYPDTLPAGTGNKPWQNKSGQGEFLGPTDDRLDIDNDDKLDFD